MGSAAGMRVLVTGAGLVGCHAAAELARAGHEVTLLDARPDPAYARAIAGPAADVVTGDVTDVAATTRALRRARADAVVHSAALLGDKARRAPHLAFRVNAWGTAAVAEAARAAGVRRLVHLSSLAVYDWEAVRSWTPVGEDFPTAPRNVYAASKLAGEAAARCYRAMGWLEVATLRLAGVYGPGQFRGGSRMGSLLQRTVAAALRGEPVTVPRSLAGHEYLHARDAARAVRLALEHGDAAGGVYNIGTGRVHGAGAVAAALRAALPTAQVDAPEAVAPQPPLDLRRAAVHLGYRVTWDLPSGIADMAGALLRHPFLLEPLQTKAHAEARS